jgi:hypothetical protein
MEDKTPEAFNDVWSRLSEDAQKLAISLATGGGLTQGKWFLEAMSRDDQIGFDLDKSMKELSGSGLLQEVTLIQEKREQLARMPKPREIILTPLDQVPSDRLKERLGMSLTDSEREYLRLAHDIEEYEANREKYPDRYKGWEEPRFRLSPEFQGFIDTTFKEK